MRLIILISSIILIISCSVINDLVADYPEDSPFSSSGYGERKLSEIQDALIKSVRYVLGKTELTVNGKSFNYDCVGAVLAVYYYAGIDLSADFNKYSGNGVSRIYETCKDNGLLYNTDYPEPGDIIFWDNTWDRDGDGRWDDYLTHMGMVTAVYEDGSIKFLHHNYARGIVIARMNLIKKDTYKEEVEGENIVINSPMRMAGSGTPDPDRWLSSQLFNSFGKGYKLGQEYYTD